MQNPRLTFVSLVACAMLIAACLLSGTPASAQQPQRVSSDELERGVELYKQGNDREAVEVLKQVVSQRKDEVRAWHYLGLALNRQGKANDARKAHEKAAKNGEKLLESQYGVAPGSDFQAIMSQLKPLLNEAADSADKYLELSSKPSKKKVDEWRMLAETLRDFAQLGVSEEGSATRTVFKASEVTTKVKILTRPEPQYTEEARENQVAGAVVLRAIFAADGKVRAVLPVASLPYGLTLQAIRAARKIKFIPATKDGKPVSQYIQLEYNFNVY
jgi:TonB family protein